LARFLIIRFSSIGDIVLTSPVVRCLKKQVPGAEVHFLVMDRFRPVVEHNPYIDKVQVWAHSQELVMEELKTEDYDYIIDLQHNRKSARVKTGLRKKSFTVNKLNIRKYIYTSLKINMLPKIHIVDRYLDTLKSFGVKNDGAGLDYFIAPEEETSRGDIPGSHYAGYIGCVIGAAHGTKRWPVAKWKSFCEKMDHPVILLGGPGDTAAGEEIASVDPVKVYNACGKFKLNESADLVRKARLVISNDTGLMHIAAAFKRPVISLWGNTVPSFGMFPYYGNRFTDVHAFDILQTPKLWCRPCSKIGYSKCPLGHFNCMERISVEEVLERTRQRLKTG